MQSNISVSVEEFSDFFEISRIQEWIEGNGHKRIALQFPPNYLLTAPELLLELERRLGDGRQCFLLADTSYRRYLFLACICFSERLVPSSCCLDENAAEHANCDSLVHFGDACLSPAIGKIPALYIFGRQQLKLEAFRENAEAKLPARNTFNSVLILCDSAYSSLEGIPSSKFRNFFIFIL
jgi:diphthamide biosynthesis protein 2